MKRCCFRCSQNYYDKSSVVSRFWYNADDFMIEMQIVLMFESTPTLQCKFSRKRWQLYEGSRNFGIILKVWTSHPADCQTILLQTSFHHLSSPEITTGTALAAAAATSSSSLSTGPVVVTFLIVIVHRCYFVYLSIMIFPIVAASISSARYQHCIRFTLFII